MSQTQNRNYKTHETLVQQVWHSCLGKIILLVVIGAVLLIIAHFNIPSEEQMKAETTDNIYQCLLDNDSIRTDDIDDAVHNMSYIFTTADTVPNEDVVASFEKFNELKYYRHAFHATMLIHNNIHPEGVTAGIGILGFVIPTVNYSDMLLRTGIMHKGYDQKVIRRVTVGSESFGSDPELGL